MMALLALSPFATRANEPIDAASNWLTGLLTGSLAIGLCVLAVAFVGLLMIGGRLEVRNGLRVVVGCFVLLGAPVIAAAFVSVSGFGHGPIVEEEPAVGDLGPREELPPLGYDPYAGASLRTD